MNRISNILFLIFCFGGLSLNAQELSIEEASDTMGTHLWGKAMKMYETDYDSAIFHWTQAIPYFQKSQNWDEVVNCYTAISSIYNYKGNYLLYDSILNKARLVADEKNIGEDSLSYQSILNSYGRKHFEIGNFDLAIKTFQKVLKQDRKSGIKLNIASVLSNLGEAFYNKGDYDQALSMFQEAKQTRFDTLGNDWRVAKTEINIGNTFRKKNIPTKALKCYQKAIEILQEHLKIAELKKSETILKPLTAVYLNLAEMALENKDWETAKSNVAIANSYSKSKGIYVNDQGRANDILGEINFQQGNFNVALNHFFKSRENVLEEFEVFEKHPIIAKKALKIAEIYMAMNDWNRAIDHFHQALIIVTHDFQSIEIQENPALENIYSKLIALAAVEGKAKCFYNLYKKNKLQADLETAYEFHQFALKIISILRQDFQKEGSKELLSPKVLPVFEKAIELANILYTKTSNPKYLEDAFSYAESNKAILLLESINDISAKKLAGIPDSLLAQEKELNLQIAYLEKLDNEEKQKNNIDEGYRNSIQRKLFQFNLQRQELIDLLEKDFPKYHDLKYNTHLVKINDVRKLLKNNSTALIEFFVGNENVYIFTITKEKFSISQFEKDASFEKDIEQIRQLISQPPSSQNIDEAYNLYTFIAQDLFKKLIKKSITPDINSLIIIPDDVLCLLPFGLLLSEAPNDSKTSYHLENLSYLIEQTDISYGYSSTLLLNKLEENLPKGKIPFSGFAPSFLEIENAANTRSCTSEELYNLDHSQNEVTRIQKIWGGQMFLGKEATLASFSTHAQQSDIIHLATHACVDDTDHQFNTIHFSDESLSNNDLFQFTFQSRLAVLSACNTGTGHLVKGEGVMSLSRGFIQAGCPSVVMSLWSVDDGTTSDIMEKFHQYLNKGENKNHALRLAKLDFLRSASKAHQHPFYWATFVQFGDTRPFAKNNFLSLKNILLLSLGVVSLFFLFRLFRKKS